MTLKQALQLDCPYKPAFVNPFTNQSLSKCIGLPCMCWIETKATYTDVKTFIGDSQRRSEFQQEHPNHVLIKIFCSSYSLHTYEFGIPATEPYGYCTLRGDI